MSFLPTPVCLSLERHFFLNDPSMQSLMLACDRDFHTKSTVKFTLVVQVIGEWVAGKEMDEVLAAMKEASVPCGPILSTADIYAEEQYQARNMFHTVQPPSGQLKSCSFSWPRPCT